MFIIKIVAAINAAYGLFRAKYRPIFAAGGAKDAAIATPTIESPCPFEIITPAAIPETTANNMFNGSACNALSFIASVSTIVFESLNCITSSPTINPTNIVSITPTTSEINPLIKIFL